MSETLEKLSVVTNRKVPLLFSSIFEIIENNYVRRSKYEADLAVLAQRINEANYLNDYSSNINDNGDLILTVPEGIDTSLLSIEGNNLILTDDGSYSAEVLSHMSFDIDHNGDLIVTQLLDRVTEDEDEEDEPGS